MNKRSTLEIVISGAIIIISALMILFFNAQQKEIDSQINGAKQVLATKKKQLNAIPNKVQKELEKSNPDNSNTKQQQLFNEMKAKGNKMMSLLYTVNSENTQKSWTKRNEELTKYATKKALNGAGSNYKSQGINRMYDLKQTFESCTFSTSLTNDKDSLKGLVTVQYRQTSNQQDNPEIQEQAYIFNYSISQKKFNQLTLLGIVKDTTY